MNSTDMDELDFTEEEIREQLENLGYHDVPQERLRQFKRDLEQLVIQDKSWNTSSHVSSNSDTLSIPQTQDVLNGQTYAQSNRITQGGRYPLDEASNRPASTYRDNGTSADHVFIGKENYYTEQGHPRYFQKEDYYRRAESREPPATTHCQQAPNAGIHIPAPAVNPDHLYHHRPDTEYSMYSEQPGDISIASTTSSDRRVIKRRVLRKKNGHSEICDESITESDPDISELQERLRNLPVSVTTRRPQTAHSARGITPRDVCSRPSSSRGTPCYRLPEDFDGPKALIRPMTGNPHTKNIRRSDPVTRYQQYQQSWQAQKAPGEKAHKSLRWNVREQMLYHDEVVEKKPQKSYVPNTYVVPSDKRRKNLRWQIRNDLAQGIKPPSAFD